MFIQYAYVFTRLNADAMSGDAIDDPLRARENSDNEHQENGSPTGETTLKNNPLKNDSGTRGACENLNTVAGSQVNDDQHKKTKDDHGKTVTSQDHETGGKNGPYESPLVNSNQTQSDKNHEECVQSEAQKEIEKNETLLPENNMTRDLVQKSSVYPKQETTSLQLAIKTPPPYNLRSRHNAAEMTLVRLFTVVTVLLLTRTQLCRVYKETEPIIYV